MPRAAGRAVPCREPGAQWPVEHVAGVRDAAADHDELGVQHQRHGDDRPPGAPDRLSMIRSERRRRRARRRRRPRRRRPRGCRPRVPAAASRRPRCRRAPSRPRACGRVGHPLGAVVRLVGAEEGHFAGGAGVAAHELAAHHDPAPSRSLASTQMTLDPPVPPRASAPPSRRGCSRSRTGRLADAPPKCTAQVQLLHARERAR